MAKNYEINWQGSWQGETQGYASGTYTITPATLTAQFASEPSNIYVGGTVLRPVTLTSNTEGPLTEVPDDVEVVYTSGDEDIATVAQDGTVTGRGVGSTTITATITPKDPSNYMTEGGRPITVTYTVNVSQAGGGPDPGDAEARPGVRRGLPGSGGV